MNTEVPGARIAAFVQNLLKDLGEFKKDVFLKSVDFPSSWK